MHPSISCSYRFKLLHRTYWFSFRFLLPRNHQSPLLFQLAHLRLQTVVVFCHGGFGLTWIAHLLGMPVSQVWSSFYLAPSSVTTILFDERSESKAVPRAISIGDKSHMYAAGLKTQISKYEKKNIFSSEPRPSGIKANYF